MRSVSVRLADLDRVKINLGIAGENEHTHVLFDCKKAFDQYPNATPFLIVTPPRGDIYPAVVTRDGDIVEWVVTDSDLIYHGNGKVQLQFKQGDIIMKSYEARTSIAISSEPTGTVPTPIQNWITQANAILASIPDDINAALAAAKASGEFDGADGVGISSITKKGTAGLVDTYTITLTDGNTYDFDVTNGAHGQDGDDGVGIQSIAKTGTSGLIDTYTIYLDNGNFYTFTVTNGHDGQSGAQIDDTTPAVDKVFSSSKVDQELTDVKTAIQGLNSPAVLSDVGKYFKVKTVTDGKVAEVEFDNPGGGGSFSGVIELDADNQAATLGEELASGTGWVLGTGWTGDFTNGFTHSSGTDALEYPITGNEEGKMYLVQFKSTVDATIPNNFFVTIGDSDPFLIFGMAQPYQLGIVSKGTGNLKITPITSFTGKITEISIKEVTEISVPYMVTIDTDDNNALEFRSGKQQIGSIFIGRNAGQWNVTGFGNVGIGEDALSSVIGGFWNTGIGKDALKKNTTGSRNVGIGYGSLQSNLSGEKNIAIGTFALISNVTGKQNIAIGADSLDNNVSGYSNIACGYQALYNVTSGYENIAFGNATGGQLTTGIRNIIIGQNTLGAIVTANYNIGIGYSIMPNTTGSYNVGLGMNALYHNTGGQYNVAIGFQAGYGSNNAGQERNVFIGPQAGLNVYNSVLRNVFIGYQAGQTLVSGSDNVCIGYQADVPAASTSKFTDINGQVKGSKVSGSEWTQVLGDLIVMGKDGVKRQIVFNNDNTISWATVS